VNRFLFLKNILAFLGIASVPRPKPSPTLVDDADIIAISDCGFITNGGIYIGIKEDSPSANRIKALLKNAPPFDKSVCWMNH
jgi:hypothetical protein